MYYGLQAHCTCLRGDQRGEVSLATLGAEYWGSTNVSFIYFRPWARVLRPPGLMT